MKLSTNLLGMSLRLDEVTEDYLQNIASSIAAMEDLTEEGLEYPTFRDTIAMELLPTLVGRTNQPLTDVDKCTSLAYEYADAMMKARE